MSKTSGKISFLRALILHEEGLKTSGTDLAVQVNTTIRQQMILAPRFSCHHLSYQLLAVVQNHDISPIIRLYRHKSAAVSECVENWVMH